jgi:hypothetical protein
VPRRAVDVASYQHPEGQPIKWTEVKAAGIEIAFIKATEGRTYVNPFFVNDAKQALAAGIVVVPYHFVTAAQGELENFVETCALVGHPFPEVMLDAETAGITPPYLTGLCNSLRFLGVKRVWLYMDRDFVDRGFSECITPDTPLFLAWPDAPENATSYHGIPLGAIQWGQGDVPGILAAVDLDIVYLDPITAEPAPQPAPPSPPSPAPQGNIVDVQVDVLRQGSRGPEVRAVQVLLNAYISAGLVPDGVFGPLTDRAVRRFQAVHGLAVDGIVGPQTWSKLIKG